MDPDRAHQLLAAERERIEREIAELGPEPAADRDEPDDRGSEDLYQQELDAGRAADLRDQLAAVAPRHLDSPAHPCPRGRDDGEAVAHAVIEKLVEIGVSGRHGRRLAQLTQGRAWCSAFPTAWRGSGTGSGRSGTGTYR